ncbi:MAG: cold shock domain-containing protein [Candidatus Omnitrophica bacterium]|nr:cold shock domain-containing protein [Candidatus Omnitrophota bacterium]
MQRGNISILYTDKEYGFIQSRDGQEALFHKECLWDTAFRDLIEGQEVEFEIQPSHKGFLAFHIRPSAVADRGQAC